MIKWWQFRLRFWNWLLNLLYTEEELERLCREMEMEKVNKK